MTWRAVAVVLATALAACSQEPLSASYFKSHRDVAVRVLAACKSGSHRGQECLNAEAAKVDADLEARMKYFRRSFK